MEKCSLGALPLTFHNNYFKTTFSLNTSFPMVARTTKTPRDLPVATTADVPVTFFVISFVPDAASNTSSVLWDSALFRWV